MEKRPMVTLSVSKLKASLSRYLRLAKAGEEILITERGKPVARLAPLLRKARLSGHLEEMERRGLLRIGTGTLPKNFWKMPEAEDPEGKGVEALLREREESP